MIMQNRKTKLKNAEQENKNHCSWRDLSPIPGLGRSPGEGNSYPLQCSGLENSMDCIIHGVAKSWTWLTFTFTFGVHRGLFGVPSLKAHPQASACPTSHLQPVVVIHSLSHVQLFATPWTAVRQTLSSAISQSTQIHVHRVSDAI